MGQNPKRLVPDLRPHGVTEKAELLWMSFYTPHVGVLFLSCMKKNCCRDQFWDFWALRAMEVEKLSSPLSTAFFISTCNSYSFCTRVLYGRRMSIPCCTCLEIAPKSLVHNEEGCSGWDPRLSQQKEGGEEEKDKSEDTGHWRGIWWQK